MYLVTGGAGFIGSHIVERLVAGGKTVRVLDNFSFGKQENLRGVEKRVEVIAGDLLDTKAVRQAVEGVEVVFHQAALRSVPLSVEKPTMVNRVNVEGTVNVLQAAWKAGVRRVVYASSSSVYGNQPALPNREEQIPSPVSPYAVSKLAGEYYCRVFTKTYGLETVSLRYFNVYGPRQDPNSQYAAVIPLFIRWAVRGEPLQVHGDGLQSRDFTYIENVVDANVRAAESPQGFGGIFNVGQGQSHSLMELADLISGLLGTGLRRTHTEAREGDVRRTLADITRSRELLSYEPRVSFETGISRTLSEQIKEEPPRDVQGIVESIRP